MNLFQKGLGSRVSLQATRPRPISRPIRSPQRARQPRRHNSSQHPPAEGKTQSVEDASSVKNAPTELSQPNTSSSSPSQSSSSRSPAAPSHSVGTAATAAGAATTPIAAGAVARFRGVREVIRIGRVGQLGRWYTRVQERKPYATQFYSSIIIYLCGDLSAQFFFPSEAPSPSKTEREDVKATTQSDVEEDKEERKGGYDPWRTVRHLIVGAGSSIPSYNWFMFLHNHFNYPSRFLSVLTKVVAQQMCFTPVFNTYFFSLHSLLAGATLEETWERLKKALPVSAFNSLKLWPAVTAFSFMYVPPQFRNVFSGCIAVGWQTYLSWLNQKAAREVLAAETAAAVEGTTSGALPMTGNMVAVAGTA